MPTSHSRNSTKRTRTSLVCWWTKITRSITKKQNNGLTPSATLIVENSLTTLSNTPGACRLLSSWAGRAALKKYAIRTKKNILHMWVRLLAFEFLQDLIDDDGILTTTTTTTTHHDDKGIIITTTSITDNSNYTCCFEWIGHTGRSRRRRRRCCYYWSSTNIVFNSRPTYTKMNVCSIVILFQ